MKKLLLAISKGRILEEALEILSASGIKCLESPFTSRKLIFETNYKNLEIIIVRASDVPIYIESGKVDFVIVGYFVATFILFCKVTPLFPATTNLHAAIFRSAMRI